MLSLLLPFITAAFCYCTPHGRGELDVRPACAQPNARARAASAGPASARLFPRRASALVKTQDGDVHAACEGGAVAGRCMLSAPPPPPSNPRGGWSAGVGETSCLALTVAAPSSGQWAVRCGEDTTQRYAWAMRGG